MRPIIYNSLDKGAPQLQAVAGTMCAVLKACLVTGYGDKQGAGWDLIFEDIKANKMAIRSKNPTSLKSVLFVDDNDAGAASVTAYSDWADGAGIEQFASGYFVKRWGSGFTPNWVVLATDKFFYLFVQTEPGRDTMRAMSGFGDAKSLRTDMAFAALLAAPTTNYDQSSTGYNYIQTNNGQAKFPNSLFDKSSASICWGDRASSNEYWTSTRLFSEFALFVDVDNLNRQQPVVQLYGMLIPHAPPAWEKLIYGNIESISGQMPYKNPILGMYQPWHGRAWIITDDWGE